MLRESLIVQNPSGLHLRPAGVLCREAMHYKCQITIQANGKAANGKSVLSVLTINVKSGETIELICDGNDEAEAMEQLKKTIQGGLGEE